MDAAQWEPPHGRSSKGNELVWQPLARARLAMLDLASFKREVRYCLLPDGVANDRCRQIDGRYRDETNFDRPWPTAPRIRYKTAVGAEYQMTV